MSSPNVPEKEQELELRGSRNTLVVTNDDGTDLSIKLGIMDKMRRLVFSKEEWEAFLIEKIRKKRLAYNLTKT